MYNIVSRCYENLSEIDFENSENKKIVSIEYFCLQVIKAANGMKYFYNDILIGAIDYVSHKYQNETPRSRAAGYQPETRFARH